jgi:hypothetical protein
VWVTSSPILFSLFLCLSPLAWGGSQSLHINARMASQFHQCCSLIFHSSGFNGMYHYWIKHVSFSGLLLGYDRFLLISFEFVIYHLLHLQLCVVRDDDSVIKQNIKKLWIQLLWKKWTCYQTIGFAINTLEYRSSDKSLAQPDWKNNWKVTIFRPTRRPGWTDNLLNRFWVACKR